MPRNKYRKPRPLFASPVPKAVRKPKVKWRILPILWLALKRGAMILGFLILFSSFISLSLGVYVSQANKPVVPDTAVLYIELEEELAEKPGAEGLEAAFGVRETTLHEYIDALDKAAQDERVKGVLVRMRDGVFPLSQLQELRPAIKRFRESGKFATIYSSSYSGLGGGLGRYYLASAFEEIWMQPLGTVSITGIRMEVPYFKSAMDSLGLEPQFFQRKEYKTAYESVMRDGMSVENREMLNSVIDDVRRTVVADITQDRNMTQRQFDALVDQGLFTAQDAQEAGLISRADYADILVQEMSEKVASDPDAPLDYLMGAQYYLSALSHEKVPMLEGRKEKPQVAVVYALGVILDQQPPGGPGMGSTQVAAADRIAPAILDAADSDTVKAIVLRVDSPGGSPVASETILRAVKRAQEKGKMVVVSMGNTAASGGYWISASADQIFALPTTLTGSIGVVGGKVAAQEMWDKIGVNWDSVEWGKNAGILSFNTPFSEGEAEAFTAMLDYTYDAFLTRVAEGRDMDLQRVERLARGRVWTGKAALENGLADQAGGLNDALDYVASTLGYGSRHDLSLIVLPRAKSFQEQIVELLEGQGGLGVFAQNLNTVAGVLRGFEPVGAEIQRLQNPQAFLTYDPVRMR